MWNDEILLQVAVSSGRQGWALYESTNLNVHEIVDVDRPKFRELLPTLFQKGCDIISLLTLQAR